MDKIKKIWLHIVIMIALLGLWFGVYKLYSKVDGLANSVWFKELSKFIYSFFGCSIYTFFISYSILGVLAIFISVNFGNKSEDKLDKIAQNIPQKNRWKLMVILLFVIFFPIGFFMIPQIALAAAEVACSKSSF